MSHPAIMQVLGDRNLLGLIVKEILAVRAGAKNGDSVPIATVAALSRVCLRLRILLKENPDLKCAAEVFHAASVQQHVASRRTDSRNLRLGYIHTRMCCVCNSTMESWNNSILLEERQFNAQECAAFQRYHYAFAVCGNYAVASYYLAKSRNSREMPLPVCMTPMWYPLSLGHVEMYKTILRAENVSPCHGKGRDRSMTVAAHIYNLMDIPPKGFSDKDIAAGIYEFLFSVCLIDNENDAGATWDHQKALFCAVPGKGIGRLWIDGNWKLRTRNVKWENAIRLRLIKGDAAPQLEFIDRVLKKLVKHKYFGPVLIGLFFDTLYSSEMIQRVIVEQAVLKFGWINPQKFVTAIDRVAGRRAFGDDFKTVERRLLRALETVLQQAKTSVVMPDYSKRLLDAEMRRRAEEEAQKNERRRIRTNTSDYTFFPAE